MGQLDRRIAIVTGAGRGQGRAHALALAAQGATVVACDIGHDLDTVAYPLATESDLEHTAAMVRDLGADCHTHLVDVRSTDELTDMVQRTVDELGGIDVLVANAGILSSSPAEAIGDAQWDEMIGVNLTGVFRTVRSVLPTMRSAGFGRIVITSSLTGRHGTPNLSHYAAAKYGVIGFAKSLALEVATAGITVNVLCPAAVDTPMIHNPANYRLFAPELDEPTREDVLPRFAGLNPMGVPWLDPEEMARAMMFLVTDPGHMTGTTIEIGAGNSARLP